MKRTPYLLAAAVAAALAGCIASPIARAPQLPLGNGAAGTAPTVPATAAVAPVQPMYAGRTAAEPQPAQTSSGIVQTSYVAQTQEPPKPLPPAAALQPMPLPPVSVEALLEAAPPRDRDPRKPYSLSDLTAITDVSNPKLRSALADVESAQGARVQAALYPNPNLETNNPELWGGRASQINFGWEQNWVVKGKIRLNKAAADQQVRVAEAQYVLERMKILTNVRTAYYETLAAREMLKNAELVLEISRTARDAAQELYKSGQRTLTDSLLLLTEYERANVAYENAQTTLDSELKQLAAATGVPDLIIYDVEGTLADHPPNYDPEYIREYLQTRSSHMEATRAEILRRKILLERAEVEPYPDWRFGPSFAANTTGGQGSRQAWLSVLVDIPMWNLNQGNIRSAHAELAGAIADQDVLRNELVKSLAETHARYSTAQRLLSRIETRILPNAQETQRLVQEGYTKGQLDVNRLLEAQRALLETRQDQIDAYERAWVAAAELAGYLQFEVFP